MDRDERVERLEVVGAEQLERLVLEWVEGAPASVGTTVDRADHGTAGPVITQHAQPVLDRRELGRVVEQPAVVGASAVRLAVAHVQTVDGDEDARQAGRAALAQLLQQRSHHVRRVLDASQAEVNQACQRRSHLGRLALVPHIATHTTPRHTTTVSVDQHCRLTAITQWLHYLARRGGSL